MLEVDSDEQKNQIKEFGMYVWVVKKMIWKIIRPNFEDWNGRDKGSIKEWTGLPQILYPYQNL